MLSPGQEVRKKSLMEPWIPVKPNTHSHLNPEKSYGTSRVEAYTCRDVSNQLGSKECYFIFSHLSFSQMCHLPKQEKLTSATFSYGVGGETVEFSWGGVQGLYEQGGVLPPQPGARNCSSGSKRCFFIFFFKTSSSMAPPELC